MQNQYLQLLVILFFITSCNKISEENTYTKNNLAYQSLKSTLAEYDLPVLKSSTSRLTDYIETLIEGKSVVNLGVDNKSAFEIRMLTKELQEFANE